MGTSHPACPSPQFLNHCLTSNQNRARTSRCQRHSTGSDVPSHTPFLSLCRETQQQEQSPPLIRNHKRCPSPKAHNQSLHLLRQAGKSNPQVQFHGSRSPQAPPQQTPLFSPKLCLSTSLHKWDALPTTLPELHPTSPRSIFSFVPLSPVSP